MRESELENLLDQFDSADLFPVVDRFPADLVTPLGAYLAVSNGSSDSFLFESVEGGESLARYSFLGANPVRKTEDNGDGSFFESLRTTVRKRSVADVEGLPAFSGGAVCIIDFDAFECFEPGLRKEGRVTSNDSLFMLFETVVAFDHAKQELAIISLVSKSRQTTKGEFLDILRNASEANKTLSQIISKGIEMQQVAPELKDYGPAKSNWKRTDFLNAVDTIKESIAAGDVYQVVLSQCFSKQTDAGPVAIYRALRALNPSPYMFLIRAANRSFIGASPEMLIRCSDRQLEYRPIAGTRPRDGDPKKDKLLALEMQADQKEVAEHTMLVDLGRNDLGRIAEYGSVKVEGLMSVEKFSHVQHLVTYLTAQLHEDRNSFDAFTACFPAGTVTGAPKIKAVETIKLLEPTSRGVYSGSVGYFDFNGNLDMCIAIRTLVLENGIARIQAGAGIVADSVPQNEFAETEHKAAGLLRAVELAETGRYGQ